MRRWFLAVLALVTALTACARPADPVSHPQETQVHTTAPAAEDPSAAGVAVSQEEVEAIISHSAIFFPDHPQVYLRGKAYPVTPAPFLEEGVLYVPAATVAAVFGGSFVEVEDVYYLDHMGNVSIMMEEYNVLLFNSDPVIMDRTPILREGELCLPLAGLGRALSMAQDKSVRQQTFLLGGDGPLEEEQFAAVRQALLGSCLPEGGSSPLEPLAQAHRLDLQVLEQAAKQRTLFVTDADGAIQALWLDDLGGLHSKAYEMSYRYPPEQVFVSSKGTLRSLTTGKKLEATPEEQYQQELRQATMRYMELLAASSLGADPQAQTLLAGYLAAVAGDLTCESYVADQRFPYETGIYDHASGEGAWAALVATARPGDMLMFSAGGAGARYGCFNHSALVLEVDRDNGSLRLLHARSSEYGVGADLPMDHVCYDSFRELDYYREYDLVFLCRAGDMSQERAEQMAWDAYDRFNGYQFGYGGRLGLEETNCAELIVDAYDGAGVQLLDGDYSSRLKEVLKGNTRNLVPIPDDLMFSGKVEVLAVWKD
ncbi:MAG: hypothetical protein IJW45_01545 [Oscillospiraceae bacterium]|nr:hypothetical protein [Oscillospiraceae bacterium]